MQPFSLQINYDSIVAWSLLTIGSIVALSIIYHFVVTSMPKNVNNENQNYEKELQKFLFISADIDNARYLLKGAMEEVSNSNLKNAVEKAHQAVKDVLTQLLTYFSVDGKDMSVADRFRVLRERGVIMPFQQDVFDRMDMLVGKANENKKLTKDEVLWMIQMSSLIAVRANEMKVKE